MPGLWILIFMSLGNVYYTLDVEIKSKFSVMLEDKTLVMMLSCFPSYWRMSDSVHILNHKTISGMVIVSYIYLS